MPNDSKDNDAIFAKALAKFEKANADAAQLVKLRYFAGMTVEETAAALGASVSSVKPGQPPPKNGDPPIPGEFLDPAP